MNMLAAIALPSSAVAIAVASTKDTPSTRRRLDRALQALGRQGESALRVNSPGITSAVFTTSAVCPSFGGQHLLVVPVTTRSQPSTRCARSHAHADGVDVVLVLASRTAVDRAALLGEAGHVDHAQTLAFEMRRHAEDRADGHDARAADAGHDHVEGAVDGEDRRIGQRVNAMPSVAAVSGTAFLILAPCTVTKDGQKPFTQESPCCSSTGRSGACGRTRSRRAARRRSWTAPSNRRRPRRRDR